MLRPHNCFLRVEADGRDRCYADSKDKDETGKAWSDQPLTQWDIGVAFGFVEMWVFSSFNLVFEDVRVFANLRDSVSFILTGLLVWREDRANKVGGGVNYA